MKTNITKTQHDIFCKRLQEQMDEHGLSRSQLARKCGLTSGAVTNWFGGGKNPSMAALNAVAKELNVTTGWLLGVDHEKSPVYDGIRVQLDEGAYMPCRAHQYDAGLDLRSPISFTVQAGGSYVVDTGIHIAIPRGMVGMLKSKSGLNVLHSITSEGVIDSGYTGSIAAKLYNRGKDDYTFNAGDKITQLVIMPVVLPGELIRVEKLDSTERGDKGFGSSGA